MPKTQADAAKQADQQRPFLVVGHGDVFVPIVVEITCRNGLAEFIAFLILTQAFGVYAVNAVDVVNAHEVVAVRGLNEFMHPLTESLVLADGIRGGGVLKVTC